MSDADEAVEIKGQGEKEGQWDRGTLGVAAARNPEKGNDIAYYGMQIVAALERFTCVDWEKICTT